MKLNVLLAKTDVLAKSFKGMLKDYTVFFAKSQGAFKGEKKTYTPKDGTVDEPSRRGNTIVQTTVGEKLQWLEDSTKEYVDALFSQEKTNAMGLAKAELVVEGTNWGEFTSLELLRLKSFLESGDLGAMYAAMPVRSDSEEWVPTTSEMYQDRPGIFESPMLNGAVKTTVKEDYILPDPNIQHAGSNYTPQVAQKTSVMELGDYTHQKFSGEWSQRQRASVLRRKEVLHTAVIEALKRANDVESVPSELTSEKIFGYLHGK